MLAKVFIWGLILFLALGGTVSRGWTAAPAVPLDDPASNAAPAWLRGPDSRSGGGDSVAGVGAWRSLGALLVVVAALLIASRYVRRRANAWGIRPVERLRVQARLRLGFRQELVVVEWEGRRMMLGVGPAFIRCLDKRHDRLPVVGDMESRDAHEDE